MTITKHNALSMCLVLLGTPTALGTNERLVRKRNFITAAYNEIAETAASSKRDNTWVELRPIEEDPVSNEFGL